MFPGLRHDPGGINDSGVIVGEADSSSVTVPQIEGFYGLNGSYSLIAFPGADDTAIDGISKSGVMVGTDDAGPDHQDGFEYVPGGQPTLVTVPGCYWTQFFGINDAGTIIGRCSRALTGPASVELVPFSYNTGTGSLVLLSYPNGTSTGAWGINNAGQIIGTYQDTSGTSHCFIYYNGNYTPLPAPSESVGGAFCSGINNVGQIVGSYNDSQGMGHGFIATPSALLDPVPTNTDPVGLLNGPAVGNTDWLAQLASSGASNGFDGRPVQGIAADGVSELVIRIPAQNVGDQFTFTLTNDQNAVSSNPQFDGALGNPGDTTFTQNQITVSAIPLTAADGSQTPFAFAVYRAPIDFVRPQSANSYYTGTQHFVSTSSGFSPPCGGPWPPCVDTVNFGTLSPGPRTDDQLASRGVTIQVEDLTTGNTFPVPVEILRPPVVMIHGLWSNWRAWNNFNPLINGDNNVDPRFYIGRIDYSYTVGQYLSTSTPQYLPAYENNIKANSLGWAYNALFVLNSLQSWIDSFKGGNNPLGIPVSDVEADVVAHSMGGDIARTLVLQPTFLTDQSFGLGSIHKLITVDTPHLGTPLASILLSPSEEGGCAENALAANANSFVLNSVQFSDYSIWPGAVGDLAPNSFALSQIANQTPRLIPTALIAGTAPGFDPIPPLLADVCGGQVGDPLAQADESGAKWASTIFPGQENDGLVPETSELAGLSATSGFVFPGVDHSHAIEGFLSLGFSGPGALDQDSKTAIPSTVIKLLNTPIASPAYQLLNP